MNNENILNKKADYDIQTTLWRSIQFCQPYPLLATWRVTDVFNIQDKVSIYGSVVSHSPDRKYIILD